MDSPKEINSGQVKGEPSDNKNVLNAESHKITTFFPILRGEGRAKMCSSKAGDSKQREMVQKLQNKDTMNLRQKNQDTKSSKADMSSQSHTSEKIRGGISVLSALKTPLSQVLRRSIEASENKREQYERAQKTIAKTNLQMDSVSNMEKKDLTEKSMEEPKLRQRAKKSFPETESGMSLRRSQKPAHSVKSFTSTLRSSTLLKKTVESNQNSSSNGRRKSNLVAYDSGDIHATKNSSGSRGSIQSITSTISATACPSPVEDAEHNTLSNQSSNSGAKAKKNRKRHFRGSTYGLYLTPARKKKKKQKSADEIKDDECSLAGTENSSYLDSEDGNSLVSDDFYTPSEKSLADEEHGPDSRNSPMLTTTEQKCEQSEPNSATEEQGSAENNEPSMQVEVCETSVTVGEPDEISQAGECEEISQADECEEISQANQCEEISQAGECEESNQAGDCEESNQAGECEETSQAGECDEASQTGDCDEVSQSATEILQQLGNMHWEPTSKSNDGFLENQFSSDTLKAPQYDDISNESFSNSTLFPFKESPIENLDDINKETENIQSDKSDEPVCMDVANTEDIDEMTDITEEREITPEISQSCASVDDNLSQMLENNVKSDPTDFVHDISPPVELNDLEQKVDNYIPTVTFAEKEESKESDGGEKDQSTIATCVKSRQRIKRRFTDDIVDTDVGLLSLNSMPASRKLPPRPDPPQDIIENFQSVTHSEAKRGPVAKIECIYNTHQKPVRTCTCEGETYEAKLGDDDDGVFCQAVDSIDDKLVGCSNSVVTTRLVRSSVKIPFTIMCEMHLWRLKHHHSCPYCGLFCSQGSFMQCSTKKNKQKIIHLYHEQCQSKEEGITPFCLHCGTTSGMKRVQLEIHMATPPSLFLSQLPSLPVPEVSKARISFSATSEFLRKEEEEQTILSYTIEDSGKVLSAAGLPSGAEKEELSRLLQILNEERVVSGPYSPTELYDAAGGGNIVKVLNILAQGIDPNEMFPDFEKETALHSAAAGGHTTIVHLLIQAGAVNDALNEKMYTPLMLAVENGHQDVCHYLVKKGAMTDFKGENGMSSLHLAAKKGNLDVVKILMSSRSVDVNGLDDGGWTPIVWASEHDHFNVVKYLLQRGADPNLKDNEGNTGLHWSAFSGSVDICYLYLDYGCEIDAVNERGDTPLHIASRQDSFPCVTLLLSRGADVQIRNKAEQLPAECCIDKNSDTYLSLSLNMLLKKITSKYKHKAEKIVHRDISRGKEPISIQCVNAVDDELPPLDFLYVTENCETVPIKIDRTITSLQSCHCEDDCTTSSCSCSSISYQCWYDKEGLLLPEFNLLDPPMLFECNRACSCWTLNCHNRVLQNGITARLQLIRTKGKGWGVRALKDIPKGAFICEYVGELISDSAADKRADDSYLFDLDNRDGETYCLDARYYGNISRFINHLCEPNLVPVKIYVDHQDLNFPRIAFFSSRDIKQYEELGFDYGEKFWAIKYKFFTCDCGTPKCKYSKETIHATLANYYRRIKEEQMEEAASQQPEVQLLS